MNSFCLEPENDINFFFNGENKKNDRGLNSEPFVHLFNREATCWTVLEEDDSGSFT